MYIFIYININIYTCIYVHIHIHNDVLQPSQMTTSLPFWKRAFTKMGFLRFLLVQKGPHTESGVSLVGTPLIARDETHFISIFHRYIGH